MTAPQLHHDPITINCRKVLAGAALLGVELQHVHVAYFEGEHRRAPYLALNPNGMLPTLVDGDLLLWESNAILQYLAAIAPEGDTHYPADPRARADVNRWMFWESAHWFGVCYVYLVENVVKPLTGSSPDAALLAAHEPNFHRFAATLEARLAEREWICGALSIADLCVAAPMHVHEAQRLPLSDYPELRRWIAAVEALECWRSTDIRPALGLPVP